MASTSILADTKSLHFLLGTLGPQQQMYVEARVRGSMPVAAARISGCKDADASAADFEKNSAVRSTIEYALRVAAHEVQLTKKDVVNGMLDAVRIAQTATELVMAWREIGKLVDAYAPLKVEHTHTLTKEQVAKLSDEELAKAAALDGEFVRLEEDDEVPQEAG